MVSPEIQNRHDNNISPCLTGEHHASISSRRPSFELCADLQAENASLDNADTYGEFSHDCFRDRLLCHPSLSPDLRARIRTNQIVCTDMTGLLHCTASTTIIKWTHRSRQYLRLLKCLDSRIALPITRTTTSNRKKAAGKGIV